MDTNKYWQSLEELKGDPEFERKKYDEFPEKLPLASLMDDQNGKSPTSRRDFLKYMGFSITAATLAASCEMPVRKAIPYVFAPEQIKPGTAVYYASTFFDGSDYASILIKTRDGRPIKLEGNERSSINKGGTIARVQGSVLDLYNNNRKKGPAIKIDPDGPGKAVSWLDMDKKLLPQFGFLNSKGKEITILTSTIISPSTKKLIADFKAKYPTVKHVQYDPVSYSAMLDANKASFGKRSIPEYHFDKATHIVSFAADFLGTWLAPGEFAPDYAVNRNPENGKMSRHIQFESTLSLTGSNADIRVALKPSDLKIALLRLYNELASKSGAPLISAVPKTPADDKIKKTANELWNNRGSSIVICGINNRNEQEIVNGINELLGNYGKTISFASVCNYKQGSDKDLAALITRMKNKEVGGILIHNCNPLFDHSMAAEFGKAVKNVNMRISFANAHNETDAIAQYFCPTHHYLEAWSDAEPKKGYFSLGQPGIRNIFDTRQFEDSLLTWMQDGLNPADYDTPDETGNAALPASAKNEKKPKAYRSKFYEYIQAYWKENIFPLQNKFISFQSFWDKALHDGVFEMPASDEEPVYSGDVISAATGIKSTVGMRGDMELTLYEKVGIGNGQYADNPWLQELPDPISKATWDNYVLMSVSDAEQFGLSANDQGRVFEIEANGYKVKLPVVVQPGQAVGTLSIALGYGRTVSGKAGMHVGKNAYPFQSFKNGTFQNVIHKALLSDTGTHYKVARTQMHHVINSEGKLNQRTIIFEGILPELEHFTESIKEKRQEFKEINEATLYPGFDEVYSRGHHWEMSIDLNTCIGCGACAIACHAENNVPVVGKTEVSRAHEMHWMRIDRYYTGEDMENPDIVFQPMLCQHCDNAPCENVCPVNATNHSSEGLNQMAYNRCVGTRYCANNCPYKVRRFNWYDFLGADSIGGNEKPIMDGGVYGIDNFGTGDIMVNDLTRMVLNPDVTVRSRGVMEKCSFCVQRIQEGKLAAKKEGRKLKDGDVKSACMQACPTNAITFGDGNDAESKVARSLKESDRTYYVIEEINTKPSVGYKAKVRNRSAEEDMERKNYVRTEKDRHEEEAHS